MKTDDHPENSQQSSKENFDKRGNIQIEYNSKYFTEKKNDTVWWLNGVLFSDDGS